MNVTEHQNTTVWTCSLSTFRRTSGFVLKSVSYLSSLTLCKTWASHTGWTASPERPFTSTSSVYDFSWLPPLLQTVPLKPAGCSFKTARVVCVVIKSTSCEISRSGTDVVTVQWRRFLVAETWQCSVQSSSVLLFCLFQLNKASVISCSCPWCLIVFTEQTLQFSLSTQTEVQDLLKQIIKNLLDCSVRQDVMMVPSERFMSSQEVTLTGSDVDRKWRWQEVTLTGSDTDRKWCWQDCSHSITLASPCELRRETLASHKLLKTKLLFTCKLLPGPRYSEPLQCFHPNSWVSDDTQWSAVWVLILSVWVCMLSSDSFSWLFDKISTRFYKKVKNHEKSKKKKSWEKSYDSEFSQNPVKQDCWCRRSVDDLCLQSALKDTGCLRSSEQTWVRIQRKDGSLNCQFASLPVYVWLCASSWKHLNEPISSSEIVLTQNGFNSSSGSTSTLWSNKHVRRVMKQEY